MTVVISDEELEALRRHGFGVAYRMLGSVSEAEDIAQEALLRLTRQEARSTSRPPGHDGRDAALDQRAHVGAGPARGLRRAVAARAAARGPGARASRAG